MSTVADLIGGPNAPIALSEVRFSLNSMVNIGK